MPDDNEVPIGWQEAVARLARERTLAETSARLLKQHGSPAAVASGALVYGEAKAEYDGIIAGLTVALARKQAPTSLPGLEAALRRGFAQRTAFCQGVARLLPAVPAGQRGVLGDIVGGAVGPLLDAIKAIWLRVRDDDALMRKTIETQLEATAWPEFSVVTVGP